MPDWVFALADASGTGLGPVGAPVTLKFARNTAAEVTFTIDLEDDAAVALVAALRSGLPKVRAYRDGVLRFNGNWTPMEENGEDDSDNPVADLNGVFRGPFDSLARRYTAPLVQFTSTDAGTIARSLITTANAAAPTGLRLGSTVATQARDRTYEHKQVAEAITELTAVDGGFDFTETYVDEGNVLAAFDIMARQGADKPDAVFEHGPGTLANVGRVTRRWLTPINCARVLGENGLYGEKIDPGSMAAYGQHMVVVNTSGVVEQATLNDKAIALLRPNPIEIVEFQPDPARAPQPWVDYWLGDTVPIRCRIGSLSFEASVRINGITVTVDAEGNESSHALTFENTTSEVG